MYSVKCFAPSSFFSSDEGLVIFDEYGNIFYVHPNKTKKINFNLPVGQFFTENNIMRKEKFVPYTKGWEKFDSTGFVVRVGVNPNKLTVTPALKDIIADHSINDCKYIPLMEFCLGHELSHTLPSGKGISCTGNVKNFCDENSANRMLAIGYNPSQINIARKMSMSDSYRSDCLEKQVMKPKYRR